MREQFPTRQVVPKPTVARPYLDQDGASLLSIAQPALSGPNLLQFVMGLDPVPRLMTTSDIERLGDVFTSRLLLKGKVPLTVRELHSAISELTEPAFPVRNMFLIAEGGQSPTQELNDRLVFTWQTDSNSSPAFMLSATANADSPASLLQLIAWSDEGGEFHYFERQKSSGMWAWAGSSNHALDEPTRGKGPFDSHINGSLVMKELKAPWTHWHSMNASIDRSRFPDGSEFNTDPLFSKITGAETLETIVREGIRRWTLRRVASRVADNRLESVGQFMRQVLWSTSVNLASTSESPKGLSTQRLALPASFFFDIDGLDFCSRKVDKTARIVPNTLLSVDRGTYREALQMIGIKVADQAEPPVELPGDTHFAFLVPERAAEDQEVLKELVRQALLSPKLALALLMIDFSNPVFSPARAQLLRYVPRSAVLGAAGADFERQFLDAIQDAAPAPGGAEQQLLDLMAMPNLLDFCTASLADYHAAVTVRLQSLEGIADVLRLADSRRSVCRRKRALFEFESTLALSAMPLEHLEMSPAATLATKSTDLGEGET